MSGVLKGHASDQSKIKIKEILRLFALPAVFVAVYLVFYAIWILLGLPSQSEILKITQSWFEKYGLVIVFVGAIVEGMLLFGNYFPGSLIIFLSVIAAGKDIGRVFEIIIVVSIAFTISYTIDYFLGKYGWYRVLAKIGLSSTINKYNKIIAENGLRIVFLSYWSPNLASLVATSSGIVGVTYRKFIAYSLLGILSWNIFWAILIFLIGKAAIGIVGIKFAGLILILWVLLIMARRFIKNEKIKSLAKLFPY